MQPRILFKALADSTRFALLTHLLEEDHRVSELVPLVGKSQPTVSIHLKQLESLGIVTSRKEGRNVTYSIDDPRIRAVIEAAQHVEPIEVPQ